MFVPSSPFLCTKSKTFYIDVPVKNVTWILLEIPCHFISQTDGRLVQIDTKFHDHSMSFSQVLFVFHAGAWHGFWRSSNPGISVAFAKKMMGFSSDLVSFLTKLPSKRHEKMHVIFFTRTLLWCSPCRKFDMDSHGNSMLFHITNWRQFERNWHQIPWPFHVIYIQVVFVFHAQTW